MHQRELKKAVSASTCPFVDRYIATDTLMFQDNVQYHLLQMYYVSY